MRGMHLWRARTLCSGFGVSLLLFSLAAQGEPPKASDVSRQPVTEEKTLKDAKKNEAPKVNAEETKDDEGVKTFKFSEVEVEGRLKAPQILYFLRRVRAEFRAGLLGHRSFFPELSDTRRSPSLK